MLYSSSVEHVGGRGTFCAASFSLVCSGEYAGGSIGGEGSLHHHQHQQFGGGSGSIGAVGGYGGGGEQASWISRASGF